MNSWILSVPPCKSQSLGKDKLIHKENLFWSNFQQSGQGCQVKSVFTSEHISDNISDFTEGIHLSEVTEGKFMAKQ
jgi:hypothetical protein